MSDEEYLPRCQWLTGPRVGELTPLLSQAHAAGLLLPTHSCLLLSLLCHLPNRSLAQGFSNLAAH